MTQVWPINRGYVTAHTSGAQASQVMLGIPVPASGNAIQMLDTAVLAKSGSLAAVWTAVLAIDWSTGVPVILAPEFSTKNNPSGAPDPTVSVDNADIHSIFVTLTGVATFEIDWLVSWDGEQLVI